MQSHFQSILNQIVLGPSGQQLSELSLLSPEEKLQLLEEFQGEQVDYPQDQTVLDLFAEQVERCGSLRPWYVAPLG